jgi:hypothetical protein
MVLDSGLMDSNGSTIDFERVGEVMVNMDSTSLMGTVVEGRTSSDFGRSCTLGKFVASIDFFESPKNLLSSFSVSRCYISQKNFLLGSIQFEAIMSIEHADDDHDHSE